MRISQSFYRLGLPKAAIFAAVVFALTPQAHACLWDWDTLQMERRRFPGVLEVITGKFVRHSPAYYEWRIQDRTERIRKSGDDPALADDLAVAFAKLGRHAEAIALLEQTLSTHPDRYESLANLGTVHMLAGDWKTGKDYIDRAIAINPNAHFGRERYQSLLAEWFLTARESPHPVADWTSIVVHPKENYCGFAKFVLVKRRPDYLGLSADEVKVELAAAQTGVLGMMHFADYRSPLLLEALGDLLIAWPSHSLDALQLAARAYFRIAQLSDIEAIQTQFRSAAKNTVIGSLDYIDFRGKYDESRRSYDRDELEKLSAELERELAEARTFAAAVEADEQRWIQQGIDVDQAFAAKYYDSLESTVESAKKQLESERLDVRGNPYDESMYRGLLRLGGILSGVVAVIAGTWYAYRRFRAKA